MEDAGDDIREFARLVIDAAIQEAMRRMGLLNPVFLAACERGDEWMCRAAYDLGPSPDRSSDPRQLN